MNEELFLIVFVIASYGCYSVAPGEEFPDQDKFPMNLMRLKEGKGKKFRIQSYSPLSWLAPVTLLAPSLFS